MIEFMEARLADDLSIAELASIAGPLGMSIPFYGVSPGSQWLTGQILFVNGGLLTR